MPPKEKVEIQKITNNIINKRKAKVDREKKSKITSPKQIKIKKVKKKKKFIETQKSMWKTFLCKE